MAAARLPYAPEVTPQTDDADAPARAEMARLLLEGARRLRRERDLAESTDEPALLRKRRRVRA